MHMPRYRFYLIDHCGQSRAPPIDMDVATDAEALMHAFVIAKGGGGAEAWMGLRLVCRVPRGPIPALSKTHADPASPALDVRGLS
jgi:hypothetical protein